MEDLMKEAMNLLLQLQNVNNELFDYYMDKPMNMTTYKKMHDDLIKVLSSNYSNYSLDNNCLTIHYDGNDNVTDIEYNYPIILTKNNVINLISKIEEELEEYIYDTFDRDYIQEYGSYVYSVFNEKSYDIIKNVIVNQSKYILPPNENNLEEIIDIAFNAIDFDYFYRLIDDIPNQPITMEEKMKEVGMSYKDFL